MLKKHALVVATIALIAIAIGTLIYAARTIQSRGTIGSINVDLYWDYNLTNPIADSDWIDWGFMFPGEVKNQTIYVHNPGNLPADISVVTSDWTPANASDFIWLDWILLIPSAPVLQPGDKSDLVLELNVNESISGIVDFYFNITVVGSWLPPG